MVLHQKLQNKTILEKKLKTNTTKYLKGINPYGAKEEKEMKISVQNSENEFFESKDFSFDLDNIKPENRLLTIKKHFEVQLDIKEKKDFK